MSLTSLFNFNYLKENIKKSKAIILFMYVITSYNWRYYTTSEM
ncbi:MAG: hypothetical protein ACLUG3_01870 [Bacilli bacterium]